MATCKCQACGGEMEYNENQNILCCPFCGSKDILRNYVSVQNVNINVSSGALDAETLFENWITLEYEKRTTNTKKQQEAIANELNVKYTTHPLRRYIQIRNDLQYYTVDRNTLYEFRAMIDRYMVGERLGKYRNGELSVYEASRQRIVQFEMNNGISNPEVAELKRQIAETVKQEKKEQARQALNNIMLIVGIGIIIVTMALLIIHFI